MHVTGMRKEAWARPYTNENILFHFDDQVNVLIGPNASGKTTLLRALHYRLAPRVTDDRYEGVVGFAYRLDDDAPGYELEYSEDWPGSYAYDWDDGEGEEEQFLPVIDLLGGRTVFVDAGRRAKTDMPLLIPDRWSRLVFFRESETYQTDDNRLTSFHDLILIQQDQCLKVIREISENSIDDRFRPDEIDRAIANVRQTYGILDVGGIRFGNPTRNLVALRDEVTSLVRGNAHGVYRNSNMSVEEIVDATGQEFLTIYSVFKNRSEQARSLNETFEYAFGSAFWVNIPDEEIFMHASGETSRALANFKQAIYLSYFCAKEICGEIIHPALPEDIASTRQRISDRGVPDVSARLDVGTRIRTTDAYLSSRLVDFSGQVDFRLGIEELSAGTGETLCWIRSIALQLLADHNFQFGWEKEPAILLIDEIENHLHPTWQRRVIPALLKYFPGLQIFATTHSPFVVAGLKAGQVHLLNRYENGVVTATTNTEDIVGWTADEILRTMMGVDDPTDDETARNAAELRQLRNEGPRADEREEAERQKRMQQLRRLVDRDLLAGGPKARRREDFARRFREAMERQRQEEELNQDNG